MQQLEPIICKILEELGYGEKQIIVLEDEISIVLYKNIGGEETQYYIISECDEEYLKKEDFKTLQRDIYKKITEIIEQEPEMEKNTSWLIGIKCQNDYTTILKEILAIEEDVYYFKKMVFPYSESELEEVLKELGDNGQYIKYIEKEVIRVDRFEAFCSGKDSSYGFFSRLLIKIPNIKLQINNDKKIDLLSSDIEQEIKIQGLDYTYNFLKNNMVDKIKEVDEEIEGLKKLYYGKEKINE